MLAIMLHHICNQFIGTDLYLFVFDFTGQWGYLGTGVFFLLSGFGLSLSLESHQPITLRYWIKHLWGIVKPFLVIFLFDYIAYSLVHGFDVHDMLTQLVCLNIGHKDTWFLKVIFGAYVVSMLAYTILKNRNAKIILICASSIVYFACAIYALSLSNKWYITCLNFPLGALIAYYYPLLKTTIQRTTLTIVLVASLMAYGVGFYLLHSLVFASLAFSIFAICLFCFIRMNFATIDFIGKYSIYFYLGH